MTKTEFLNMLENEIKSLPDYEKAMDYYSEMIDDRMEDGMSEEDAVNSCDSIHMIRRRIIEETPIKNFIRTQSDKPLNGINIILLTLSFPIWFPILLACGIIVLALFFTGAALMFSLYIVVISLALAGILGFVSSFFYINVNIPYAIFSIGLSLVMISLSMLLARPVIDICHKILEFTKWSIQKIKTLFIGRGGKS